MALTARRREALRPSVTIHRWQGYALWMVAAAGLGFAVTALFSAGLELSRNWLLVPYFAITIPFLVAYVRWADIDVWRAVRHHWVWGVIGGAVVGTLLVMNIVTNEPASPRPEGLELIRDLLWLGVAYGTVDALLLTVMPVSAVWLAFKSVGATASWKGKIAAGVVAMLASLVVTAAYHLGYTEFRGDDVSEPLTGNGIMTLGYLLSTNPITAIVSHIALHVSSVWHGVDTTVTLPPHY
jgi:hypothetical protein